MVVTYTVLVFGDGGRSDGEGEGRDREVVGCNVPRDWWELQWVRLARRRE